MFKRVFSSFIVLLVLLLLVINSFFLIQFYLDDNLRDFYYHGEELSDIFLVEEKLHMQDVKDIVNSLIVANLLLLISCIFIYQDARYVGHMFLGLMVLFFIFGIFFEYFFFQMHYLFFDDMNWYLPNDAILIETYPMEYFKNAFAIIVVNTGLLVLIFDRIVIRS